MIDKSKIRIVNMVIYTTDPTTQKTDAFGDPIPYYEVDVLYKDKPQVIPIQVEWNRHTNEYVFYNPDWSVDSDTLIDVVAQSLALDEDYEAECKDLDNATEAVDFNWFGKGK